VVTVSTEALVARHLAKIMLSPINSGSTLYKPPMRGRGTFQRVTLYPFDVWVKKRGRNNAVAEVAVLGGIGDIEDIALRVERRKGARVLEVLWQPHRKAM
jgi:hypothetical protein